MKSISKIMLGVFTFLLFFSADICAQEKDVSEEFTPAIIVISRFHWNPDSDKDFSDWKKIEQEYFDKVTSKNDLILSAGVYTHYVTPDDSEVIFVSIYNSWEDIEDAKGITAELIEQGWDDLTDREDFFKIQNGYYDGNDSNEIVMSLPYQKDLVTVSEEPLIYYVRKNKIGQGGSGYKEFFDNIIMKNKYIKGYFTHRQLYGSSSKDAVEVAVFESLTEFDKAHDENVRLIKEYWPDEKKRKEFFKEFRKIFAGHGDFIYQNVPELAK